MNKRIFLAFLFFCAVFALANATIGGYISENEKSKFAQVVVRYLKIEKDDIVSPYYGAKTFALLDLPVVLVLKMDNCAHIKALYKPAETPLDVTFNALNAWNLLKCDGKVHTDETIKVLRQALESDKSTVADVRYALELLTLLGQPIPAPAKVAASLQAKLKKDDALPSLGHALHAAALLGAHGKFMHDRVEDVVVQADEVDGRLLQWEGGLTTTSLLVTGLLRLRGADALTPAQADKVANYLLTRKTVQTGKGVLALMEACTALAASKVSPISISILTPQVSVEKSQLRIKVCDIFGKPLKTHPSPFFAQSVTRITDDVVVLHKEIISPSAKATEYVLPLKPLEPGHYKVAVDAGGNAATLYVRFLGPIEIKLFEIGLADPDGAIAPKLSKLTRPEKLSTVLQGESNQQLLAKFALSRPVHQAFLRLYSGKKEIVFVAELDSNKIYKVAVNLGQELTSGTYDLELILGDSIISNPIRWELGTLEAKLGTIPAPSKVVVRGPKPEIKHLFREPEKRPSPAVSLFFSGLTAAPFLLLLALWGKMGVRVKVPAAAVPFHLGFGAILGLFALFWVKLDMFTTCAWLIPIGGFTFLAGHKLLSRMAAVGTSKKADK